MYPSVLASLTASLVGIYSLLATLWPGPGTVALQALPVSWDARALELVVASNQAPGEAHDAAFYPRGLSHPFTPDDPLVGAEMDVWLEAHGQVSRSRVITYTVEPGDTLSAIAARFGISMDAIRWSNPQIEYNPDDIYPGQTLRIPPVEGVVVEVRPGDTVESLARRYNVSPEAITSYPANQLEPPYTLEPGTLLIIPGGRKVVHVAPPQPHPGYAYMWPVRGTITQRFSARHRGWDIATVYDASVYAARSGRVRVVRWDNTGYGYMVIIDHGDGWNTLYAHLKGALVSPGQWVNQGDIIGKVGGTGRATGPHVHFEIRRGYVRYDPAQFLPPSP